MPYERKTYDLFISDDLREILLEFESESSVASLLLKKRHDKEELVENAVNFISISRDDNTKISYLTSERMSTIDVSDYWTSSRRFQAKPGAFISKVFKNISSKEVEKFSNLYRSTVNKPKFTLNVVSGDVIKSYYHWESYAKDRGTLGSSCMKHDSCQSYMNIYSDNPDTIKMLVMKDEDGRLMGRALLWTFDSYKIMDRIYTISDEDLAFYFKTWATDNGYLYKSEQNWYNTLNFEQIGQKRQELQLKVKLKNFSYGKYPYVDTFKFFNPETGELTNYLPEGRNFKTLCSSDGAMYEYDYVIFDGIDRVLRHRGDVVYLDYLNIHTHCSNADWSDVNSQFILHKHASFNETIEDFVFCEEFQHLNNNNRIQQRDIDMKTRSRKNLPDIIKELNLNIQDDSIRRLLEEYGLDVQTEVSE